MVSLTRACLFVGPGSDNAPGVARVNNLIEISC
jgi:hypothetical protein